MKSIFFCLLLMGAVHGYGQFHSLTLPVASPPAKVVQQVGVTTIEIEFGSPSVNGRDIWNDPNVIPQQGKPIAWRAGANANTTISFDTDVLIEGKRLPAGKYGFHIVPDGHSHKLLFAGRNNLWGSYYLDQENDPALSVTVKDAECPFSEHLDYEFSKRTDSSVTIALEWGDRQIPFQVAVDLNTTTLEKLRYELNGDNTYKWQAWNDAAAWCLRRGTNLEEALEWVNRSIGGGYGGFGANKNMRNMGTKIRLLQAMRRDKEMESSITEAMTLAHNLEDARTLGSLLIQLKRDESATTFLKDARKSYAEDWVLVLFSGVAAYFQEDYKKADAFLKQCAGSCPEFFKGRLETITKDMDARTYAFPNR